MVGRSCSICGRIAVMGSRCGDHPVGVRRGRAHAEAARAVVAASSVCWRCGLPARPGDPLTGDHVVARADGGSDSVDNMLAAHLSCNSRGGQAMLQGLRS